MCVLAWFAGDAGNRVLAATNMTPIAVTGWNEDVVIEDTAVGPPFTNVAVEVNAGEGNAYYQTGLPQYAWGLPPSGAFVSLTGDRTLFQFQPYTTMNALVLSRDTGLTAGTLTLSQPATYGSIAILAQSCNGTNATGPLTLHFADGSSFQTTYYAPDWMNGTVNVAWFGPGRVNLITGADTTGPENPCFYETSINLQALLGAGNKPLASLTFGKTQANTSAIYAVSGIQAGAAQAVGEPITATGWNRDLVIENTAASPPYSNYAQEFNPGEGTAYYQSGLPNTSYGLPLTGSFASAVDTTVFQLQPYTTDNALVLSTETGIAQGSLTLTTAAVYDSLSLLANSAGGGGAPEATIHFADGSSFVTNFNAQDWFTGTQNIALSGFDRINLTSGATDGGPAYPHFYQTTFDLVALFGPTNKPIASVTFNQAAGAGATAIYALSGVVGDQTNGTFTLATITNAPASDILTRSATLGGDVASTGGAAPEVFLYYGTADGGTNPGAWDSNVYLGAQSGSFSLNVSGLAVNTTYYFRVLAINPAGSAWAPGSQSFATVAAAPATVINLPATNVESGAAILSGTILSTGDDPPSVTIFYGQTNGGTTPGAWAQSAALSGTQNGGFAQAVSGLSANTTYYYSAQAVNAGGTAWGTPTQHFTTAATNLPPTHLVSVLTGRNDNARTGQNTNETALAPANVNANSFGKLFSHALDGYMMTQPLILPNVAIPGRGIHNLIIAATENDSVYAFDSDSGNGPNAQPLWKTSFINPAGGITPLQSAVDLQASSSPGFYGPLVGISGTPVIDPVTGTIYVAAKTKEVAEGVTNFVYRLHALDVATGAEKFGGPIVIDGSVAGEGDGFVPYDTVDFLPLKHMNRPALLLANGILTVTFTSHQDFPPYHGWVFTYNAYTLQPLGVFNTTPNGSAGGIWQASSGPAADTNGNIYFETGNGTFDAYNDNYGDSVVKLSTDGGLTLADYFTPYNQLTLNLEDLDIGSAGLILLPDSVGSAAHPHLLVAGSKTGVFWLLDRDNLGEFNAGGDTQIVQEISGQTRGMWVTPAYFNGAIYYCAAGDNARAFSIANGEINPTPFSISTNTIGYPGASLSISANGVSNAIAWGLDTSANQNGPAVLHAWNATNLEDELYNSSQNLARDNPGLAVKYTMPTIANGKVFVGTANYLSIFGNLSSLTPPVIAPAGGVFTNSVTVSITTTDVASIFYTLDGSVPTTNSILYSGPFVLTNNDTVQAVAAAPGQPDSPVNSVTFSTNATLVSGPGVSGPYANAVLADGPLGYWPLNETNGIIAYDYAGGDNGTYVGDVILAQPGAPLPGFGSPGYAAVFDGLSAYVDIPEGPFNITEAITAMAWVNVPTPPSHFSGLMGHGDQSWRTSINPVGEPGSADGSNPDATSPDSIVGTGWHFVAYVYTGIPNATNNGSLYVDGVLKATNTVNTPVGDALDVWIGGSPDYGSGRLLSGSVAQAAVFAKALSPSQIMALYNAASITPTVTLSLVPTTAGSLTLTWPQGTLLQSTNLNGPWATNNAISPYVIPTTNAQKYFKVLVK
ncbi:MAG: LamG-like jellyroll fold domain-containing protein [Verrucomicrobiota bacterium]